MARNTWCFHVASSQKVAGYRHRGGIIASPMIIEVEQKSFAFRRKPTERRNVHIFALFIRPVFCTDKC